MLCYVYFATIKSFKNKLASKTIDETEGIHKIQRAVCGWGSVQWIGSLNQQITRTKSQGLGGTLWSRQEKQLTHELPNIPKVSYGSKCKAALHYSNTLRYNLWKFSKATYSYDNLWTTLFSWVTCRTALCSPQLSGFSSAFHGSDGNLPLLETQR